MSPQIVPTPLRKLYERIENCARCTRTKNPLRHIFGGGEFHNPKFFFLFINPTHKNRSSNPAYEGRRFPFIGVRHFWKGMAEAGFMDPKLIEEIYAKGWQSGDELWIEAELRKRSVYITNFVKCAQPHPRYPAPHVMKESLPLLTEELSLVNPSYIVTFGAYPLQILTGTTHLLRDILGSVRSKSYKPLFSLPLAGKKYPILPCYFPLGHGNPPKAKEILRYIQASF